MKAFIGAYQLALKAGYPRADNPRWRAILPWVLVRLAHHRGLDGRYRLFRYSHWIPAQWRDFHELYEFARMRGWQREQLVLGGGAFAQPGITLEQEYVQTLLLMRLDSGNFTPDQVASAVKRIAGRVPVEVSGGIRLENVRAYAEAGPDYIAVGALTHSAPAVDISLDVEPAP